MKFDFTPESATAVMELTSHPKWGVLQTMYNSRRQKVRDRLEEQADERSFRHDQGRAEEIRLFLELREKASAFLQAYKQTR